MQSQGPDHSHLRRRLVGGLAILFGIALAGYVASNQLVLATRSVPMPAAAEMAYEYGEPGRFALFGNYPLYQRYVVAGGTPAEVCADLGRLLGTEFRPNQTSVSNPRPCEWEGRAWGARVRVAVLDVAEIAPNNHPITAPADASLVVVSAD